MKRLLSFSVRYISSAQIIIASITEAFQVHPLGITYLKVYLLITAFQNEIISG